MPNSSEPRIRAAGAASAGPTHVAIIMDGNGRWALERGMPRFAGYRAGARAVRRTVDAAPGLGIDVLTLFAFSSDNVERPVAEVRAIRGVIEAYLRELADRAPTGPRVRIIGRRDRLPATLVDVIAQVERETLGSRGSLDLRLAIDYSARDAIVRAARAAASGAAVEITRESFARLLGPEGGGEVRDVDLLIRTGGEQRLSDFLLWESAYAELYFTPKAWPEFGAADLAQAMAEFRKRDRRFGRVADVVAS
jgi:undecaprenyl diphosphate synthase